MNEKKDAYYIGKKISEEFIRGLENKYIKCSECDEEIANEFSEFKKKKQGISEEELNELLKEFSNIPQSFIDLLRYSNGSNCLYFFNSDVDDGRYPYYLISSNEMIEEKDIALVYEDYLDRELDASDEYDAEIDDRITNDADNAKWLLFSNCMNNGGTSQLFIDFTPSEKGKVGQVVRFLHDPDSMLVIADSFDEYLQKIIDSDYAFVDEVVDTNKFLNDRVQDNNVQQVAKAKKKSKIGMLLLLGIIAQIILFFMFGVFEEMPFALGMMFILLIPTNIVLIFWYIINKINKIIKK